MGKPELGAKHTCAACAERFYDLNRMPAVCPKCQAEQPVEKPRVVVGRADADIVINDKEISRWHCAIDCRTLGHCDLSCANGGARKVCGLPANGL